MDNPEFQQDMLESIDDALKRMAKVQDRISALRGRIVPDIRSVGLDELLRSCVGRLLTKMGDLDIELECPVDLFHMTDPVFMEQILENLLINALEAGDGRTAVSVKVSVDSMLRIDMVDNGPGIQADLLPWVLFEPFKTTKPNGSGIGLWQVRQLVESLGGVIQVQNGVEGGACFTLLFPYQSEPRLG
jgi:signal transduction histidine kinase